MEVVSNSFSTMKATVCHDRLRLHYTDPILECRR
jgi:hypothetical protein